MCWPNPFIHALTENPSQHVFTKPLPWLQKHRMYLNSSCPCQRETKNVSTCVDTNCMYTCVVQIPPMPAVDQPQTMPARTKKAFQHVLTKPLICQRGHKLYLNLIWQNPSQASEDIKCTSSCIDLTPPMTESTHNYLELCWPNTSHADKHRKFISTCVDQTIPAKTQKVPLSGTKGTSTCFGQTHPIPAGT